MKALKGYIGGFALMTVITLGLMAATPAKASSGCFDQWWGAYTDVADNGMVCTVTTWATFCDGHYVGHYQETECWICNYCR